MYLFISVLLAAHQRFEGIHRDPSIEQEGCEPPYTNHHCEACGATCAAEHGVCVVGDQAEPQCRCQPGYVCTEGCAAPFTNHKCERCDATSCSLAHGLCHDATPTIAWATVQPVVEVMTTLSQPMASELQQPPNSYITTYVPFPLHARISIIEQTVCASLTRNLIDYSQLRSAR